MQFEKLEIIFRMPHQGIIVGFESFDATDDYPYFTFRLHLSLISLSLDLK